MTDHDAADDHDALDLTLDGRVLDADPLVELRRLRAEFAALDAPAEDDMVILATATLEGRPSARAVLVREIDDVGLTFHTNRASAKGRDLEVNPRAAMVAVYAELRRQWRVEGRVEVLDEEASDTYWLTRPRESQLSASASPQSDVVPSRAWLEARVAEVEAALGQREGSDEAAPVRRPRHWGGYRLVPDVVEVWAQRRGRLHDRIRYVRDGDAWITQRLAP